MDYDSGNMDMTSKIYSLVINKFYSSIFILYLFLLFFKRFVIKNINKQLMFLVIKIKANLVYIIINHFFIYIQKKFFLFSVVQHYHYLHIVIIMHKILHKLLIVMNNLYKFHQKLMIINFHLDNHFINVDFMMKL